MQNTFPLFLKFSQLQNKLSVRLVIYKIQHQKVCKTTAADFLSSLFINKGFLCGALAVLELCVDQDNLKRRFTSLSLPNPRMSHH